MPFNGQVQLIHSDIQTVHLCTEKIFIKQIPFTLIFCQKPTLIARPRKASAKHQMEDDQGGRWTMKAFLVVDPPQARIRTEDGCRTKADKIYPATHGPRPRSFTQFWYQND